jgi:cell division protease FtsH
MVYLACGLALSAILTVLHVFYIPESNLPRLENIKDVPYSEFTKQLDSNEVDTVFYKSNADKIYVTTKNKENYSVSNPEHEGFKLKLLESGIIVKSTTDFKTAEDAEANRMSHVVLIYLISFSFMVALFYKMFIAKRKFEFIKANHKRAVTAGGKLISNADVIDDHVNNKKDPTKKEKCFDDIAGLYEVKKDVKCLVDFLNNKEKYISAGATLPRGIIFYGPPGTGKTLLAKAIAGEANVSFIYASGSDFVEMYVGVGAKRIRELFTKAKKESPCIIFIDELDAIGCKRTGVDNGEDRKTLNALLTELDGFNELDNVLVIGATNRIEDLDSALLRPGRFTNKYCVPLPETPKERLEILNLYRKGKYFDDTVDFERMSKELIGFSPAKIEALLNESAIISVQDGLPYITKAHIDKAMYKILLDGHMREDAVDINKEETKIVAWHEAGHAVVGHLLGKEITKVTIIPSTSGAGGVTFSTPKDKQLHSVEDIDHEVMELYGGRLAELLLYGKDSKKITTGASNDIERATKLIKDSIIKYGMSEEFGMLNLKHANVPEKSILDSEIKKSKELEEKALQLLEDNKDKLQIIADMLLDKSTIYHSDIVEVFAA